MLYPGFQILFSLFSKDSGIHLPPQPCLVYTPAVRGPTPGSPLSHAICDTTVLSQRHRGNQSPQRPGRLVPFPQPSDSPFNTNQPCWKQPKSLQRPVTPNQSLLGASRPEGPHRMCTPHPWTPPHPDPTQTPTQPYFTHHAAINSRPSQGISSLHP